MVALWDFTFLKACDEQFMHEFPLKLKGDVFQLLKRRYTSRDFVHIVCKDDSRSYALDGMTEYVETKWGTDFPPAFAKKSSVCRDDSEVIIDQKHTQQKHAKAHQTQQTS
jgi:hypothetical protein